MIISTRYLILFTSLLCITACKQPKPVAYDLDHPEKYDPNPLVIPSNITPAEIIANAGHGALFDHAGKPITLSDELVLSMQISMIDQLRESAWQQLDGKTKQTLEDAFKLAHSNDIKATEKTFLNVAIIETLQKNADKTLRENLIWRHNLIVRKVRVDYIKWQPNLNQRLIDIIRRLGLDVRAVFIGSLTPSTGYVAGCRAESVPIPPVWSLAAPGTWRYQGLLDNELILASADTHLWTWEDPHRRGGCILLPRGGGAAGLICQSATTGKACFWDNIPRTGGSRLDWNTATLDVNNLQDGDSLAENCTGCHRGSNVFLISPDNTTWQKVIKQSQSVANAGANFTTRIENAAVARYIPISTQATWSNPSASQCIGCHERPSVGFSTQPSPMPPTCRTSNTDPTGCYN